MLRPKFLNKQKMNAYFSELLFFLFINNRTALAKYNFWNLATEPTGQC